MPRNGRARRGIITLTLTVRVRQMFAVVVHIEAYVRGGANVRLQRRSTAAERIVTWLIECRDDDSQIDKCPGDAA